jgi:hypothetical protein
MEHAAANNRRNVAIVEAQEFASIELSTLHQPCRRLWSSAHISCSVAIISARSLRGVTASDYGPLSNRLAFDVHTLLMLRPSEKGLFSTMGDGEPPHSVSIRGSAEALGVFACVVGGIIVVYERSQDGAHVTVRRCISAAIWLSVGATAGLWSWSGGFSTNFRHNHYENNQPTARPSGSNRVRRSVLVATAPGHAIDPDPNLVPPP